MSGLSRAGVGTVARPPAIMSGNTRRASDVAENRPGTREQLEQDVFPASPRGEPRPWRCGFVRKHVASAILLCRRHEFARGAFDDPLFDWSRKLRE